MSFTQMIVLRHLNTNFLPQEINIDWTLDKIFVCFQGFQDDEKMTKSPCLTN